MKKIIMGEKMRTNTNLAAEIIYKEETLRERERERG